MRNITNIVGNFLLPTHLVWLGHRRQKNLTGRWDSRTAWNSPKIRRVPQLNRTYCPVTVIATDLRALVVGIYNWGSRGDNDEQDFGKEPEESPI